MATMEFLDDPVAVLAAIDNQGHTRPHQLSWRGVDYTLISVGRQWDTENGRHVLVEAGNGARFELQLSRSDLRWRLKRRWWVELAA